MGWSEALGELEDNKSTKPHKNEGFTNLSKDPGFKF